MESPCHPAATGAALAVLAVLAAPPALPAQQTLVLPRGMEHVEGPSVLTYPFGRTDAALQILFDADQVTLTQGLVTGLHFRASQQTQSTASYTKPYRVTAWTVAATAATMAADPATNVGTATGTVVFQGPLTVPAAGPLAVAPAPFAISLPFSTPYPFDGSQGNLLLVIETTDQTAASGTYRIDAVLFRNTAVTGIVAPIDLQGCTALGNSLTSSTAEAAAVVGGSIATTVSASAPGAFPSVLTVLSFQRQDVDLTAIGLPGCTSRLAPAAFQVLLENGGSYPLASWSIPATPALEGAAVFTQSVGLTAAGLTNAVVSNAEAIRVGSNTFPVAHVNASFRATTGWTPLGNAGPFAPVVQLEGVFP